MSSAATSAETASAAQTEALGAELAGWLRPGDIVVISGELGAGKSTLVRGACRALGVTDPIVSPTFTIGRRYEATDGARVSHLDLYRLSELAIEEPGLLDDYLTPDAIAFIEWPEVAAAELEDRIVARVRLAHAGGDRRLVEVQWSNRA